MLARYVERMLGFGQEQGAEPEKKDITEEFLRKYGF